VPTYRFNAPTYEQFYTLDGRLIGGGETFELDETEALDPRLEPVEAAAEPEAKVSEPAPAAPKSGTKK
jgi:hypothetical protein